MKPNTNKPKTAKAGRRFRGLEVAQAALLLVFGVVVALALYFIMMNIVQTTPVPPVQLDPYQSSVFVDSNGNIRIVPVLRFGRVGKVTRVDIRSGDNYFVSLATCFDANSAGYTLPVVPGMFRKFECAASGGVPRILAVYVVFADGTDLVLRWVVS